MKAFSASAVLALLLSTHAMAASPSPIKTCVTDISSLDGSNSIPTRFEVFGNAGSYHAKVTETVDGKTSSFEDTAEISEHKIRPGLESRTEADMDDESLNLGERLVAHAMMFTSDPEIGKLYSAGLNLKAIRSAKVYLIGQEGSIGMSAIIEARDASGKNLGSFLGGFLVSACK